MASSSLKKRFSFKLAANIWGMALGLLTMSFVSRILGPEDFGRFEFITANFKLIFETLVLQVPVAYFNWVSRKGHKEGVAVASGLTLMFSLVMAICFALLILMAIVGRFSMALWPGIEPVFLWEALLFTLAVFFWQLLVYLADGMSLTVGLEKIRLLQNLLKALLLFALMAAGLLNLHSYFGVQTAVVIIALVLAAGWLTRKGALSGASLKIGSFPREEKERYLTFVRHYTRPLTILMFSGFGFLYFDRWFLQLIGGAVEQGYFGLSDRLGALAFIFTSAMTPLLTREFAFAHEQQDKERLIRLFERIKLFLFIAAVISCFLSVQSDAVVRLIGGSKFQGAVVPIAIMALFPIHQTFGQLSASLLVASGQTGLYSKIGIAGMLFSMPLTYLLLAPTSYLVPGLALGATGLALKMLLAQLVTTNVQLYFNTRYLGVSYLKWFLNQALMIPGLYGLASAASAVVKSLAGTMLPVGLNALTADAVILLTTGVVFCSAVVVLVACSPAVIGTTRPELLEIIRKPLIRRNMAHG